MSQNFKTFLSGIAGGVLGAVVVLTFANTGLFGSQAPDDAFITQSVSAPRADTNVAPANTAETKEFIAVTPCTTDGQPGKTMIVKDTMGSSFDASKAVLVGEIKVSQEGNKRIESGIYSIPGYGGTEKISCESTCGSEGGGCNSRGCMLENGTCTTFTCTAGSWNGGKCSGQCTVKKSSTTL